MKWRVAYLRVSSDEQREKQTIQTQRVELENYSKTRELKFDKIYEDDGISGTIALADRPGGSDLFRDVVAGLIGEIYTVKVDRLSRNLRDFLNLRHELARYGVTTSFILQPIAEGPAGEAMLQMLGTFAEFDRKNLVENMLRGMRVKAATGWTGGRANFGYQKVGMKREAKLVPHDTNAEIVLRLFELAASGKSCQALADMLNAQGVPTSRQNSGSVWRATNIWRIIRNPIYMGKRQFGRRHVVYKEEAGKRTKHLEKSLEQNVIVSDCARIVSPELWEKANFEMKKHVVAAIAHSPTPNLLRGLIVCSLCGCRFTGRGSGRYFVCIGRHSYKRVWGTTRPPCKAPIIHRAELESSIWDTCEAYICNPGAALKDLERDIAPERNLAAEIRKEEEKLARSAKAWEAARRQRQAGDTTEEEYERDKKHYADQRNGIQIRLDELKQKTEDIESQRRALGEVRSVLETLRQNVRGEVFTLDEKRRIVEALVSKIEVAPLPANGEALGMEYADQITIRFKFHRDARGWMRGEPQTAEEVQSGAAGLRVARDATLARSS